MVDTRDSTGGDITMWINFISNFVNEFSCLNHFGYSIILCNYKESDNGYKKASYPSMTYPQCPSSMIYPSELEHSGVGRAIATMWLSLILRANFEVFPLSTYNN